MQITLHCTPCYIVPAYEHSNPVPESAMVTVPSLRKNQKKSQHYHWEFFVDHDTLAKKTRAQLLLLARQQQLKGVSRLRKADIITRLLALSPSSSPSASQAQRKPRTKSRSTFLPPSLPPPPIVDQRTEATTTSLETIVAHQSVLEPAILSQATRSRFLLHPKDEPPPLPPPDLPVAYNDNRLTLFARDPHWLYAYWDFSAARLSATLAQLDTSDAWPILRLHSTTSSDHDGHNVWNSIDITLTPFATNWHVPVPHAASSYYVEIGYLSHTGRFAAIGRSNIATTPPAQISSDTTLTWHTPPERQPSPVPRPSHPPLPLTIHIADLGSSPQ
jgi:hypothetical protein